MKRRNNPSIHSRMSQSLQNTCTSEYHTHSFISANHTYIHIYPNPPPPFHFPLTPPSRNKPGGKKNTNTLSTHTTTRICYIIPYQSFPHATRVHTYYHPLPTHPPPNSPKPHLITSQCPKKNDTCTSTPDEKDLMTPYIDTYVRIYIHEYIYLHDHRSPP